MKDAILVFPHAVGSSVITCAIYSLKVNGNPPRAIVLQRSRYNDFIWVCNFKYTLVDMPEKVSSSPIITGLEINVDADNKKIIIQTV